MTFKTFTTWATNLIKEKKITPVQLAAIATQHGLPHIGALHNRADLVQTVYDDVMTLLEEGGAE